jgi:hypothetical protein
LLKAAMSMRTYHDVEVAGGERPWDATRSVRLTAVDRRARHICMRRESCCACSPYCAVLATGRANRSIAGIAGLPLITSPKGTDWHNRVAARSLLAIGAHRPGRKAANIRCPILLILAEIDTIAPIGPALRVADRAPKSQLYRSRGGHYGRYKGGEDHDNVMGVEVEFGLKRLVDLPMAWPDQWRALGLQAARRRKETIRPSSFVFPRGSDPSIRTGSGVEVRKRRTYWRFIVSRATAASNAHRV